MIDDFNKRVRKAKNSSIVDFLESNGYCLNSCGSKYSCMSLFNNETRPSMYIYPHTNSFYDFSTGNGGDIITLVMLLNNVGFTEAVNIIVNEDLQGVEITESTGKKKEKKKFNIKYYFASKKEHVIQIKEYASSRGIKYGYFCGKFFRPIGDNKYVERIGMGFPLRDSDSNICGVKLRAIDGMTPKYELRGSQGAYVLENLKDGLTDDIPLYICESETSANSLWNVLSDNGIDCVVVSFGGVNTFLGVPSKYQHLSNRHIIIDYDGSESLYNQRIKAYEYLNANPIKIELSKGDDINSLYSEGRCDEIIKYVSI